MSEIIERAVQRPYDIPLNVAIWVSFKPMLKIYLSIGAGFLLSKKRILTPEITKGISQLVLIIFMPCLLFNNIVTQIKDTDIKLLGVIVFTGFIYYVIGLGWGFVVYLVSPIPRAWFGGLLLCCMVNNCSDLPIAYVQTIGKTPFLPANAAAQGQSYAVLIVIIFIIFTFNLGGTRLVEWDATRYDPRGEEPTIPLISWTSAKRYFRKVTGKETEADKEYFEKEREEKEKANEEKERHKEEQEEEHESPKDYSEDYSSNDLEAGTSGTASEPFERYTEADHESYLASQTNQASAAIEPVAAGSLVASPPPVTVVRRAQYERPYGSTEVYYSIRRTETEYADANSMFSVNADAPAGFQNLGRHMSRTSERSSPDTKPQPRKKNVFQRGWTKFRNHWFYFKEKNKVTRYICNFCEDIFLPQMMSLIAGITVAMIPWVRRVFVKGQNIHHFHDAPDHNPPLDFLMEFLSFFAAAQVPLGLMLLGGTIASLKVGKMVKGFWKSLVLIVIFKLAILPIIACAWIHRIREIGWISMDDAMTPIVLAVAAGTPSATVQIYLTLAWIDPTKESLVLNCLAVSLMAQYVILPLSLTILMTYIVMHYV